jgi:prevent-host-death family protein
MKRIGAHEAQSNFARLLDQVTAGETITITKRGVPVAVLTPYRADRRAARDTAAAAGLRAFRATHHLEGVAVRALINEGRHA